MKIKNVKLGEYSLKDLLENLLELGRPGDYTAGYNSIVNKINNILEDL